jgi:hypothetical protein
MESCTSAAAIVNTPEKTSPPSNRSCSSTLGTARYYARLLSSDVAQAATYDATTKLAQRQRRQLSGILCAVSDDDPPPLAELFPYEPSSVPPISRAGLTLLTAITTLGVGASLVGLGLDSTREIQAVCIAGLSLSAAVYGVLAVLAAGRRQAITMAKARAEYFAALRSRRLDLPPMELEQAARDRPLLEEANAGRHVDMLDRVLTHRPRATESSRSGRELGIPEREDTEID